LKGQRREKGLRLMKLSSLRPDLKIIRGVDKNGDTYFLLEDPVSGKIFTLQEEEHFLCEQLGMCSSLAEVMAKFEEQFHESLDLSQLKALVHFLGANGLLVGVARKGQSVWESFHLWNYDTWKRWNLFDLRALLLWLSKKLWWCYTLPFAIVSSVLLLLAIGVVTANFTGFKRDISLLVKPLSILQMFLIMWLFVNIPQEFARGISGTRFGGRVEEFGVWLAFDVIPRFYCLSRVWEISEKSRRSWYYFTPSYYALLAGSIGIIMWKITPPGISLHMFGLSLAVVCIIDSLIRFNFLWPTEIYFLLINCFEIQNLRKRAVETAKSWVLCRLMPEPLGRCEKGIFVSYGILTILTTVAGFGAVIYFIWKSLVPSYAGTGALIFLGIMSMKFRVGISDLIREGKMLQPISAKSYFVRLERHSRIIFWTISIIIILLFPYPYEAGGPFTILSFKKIELHTQVSGEIKKVFVKENDLVKRGDLQALIDVREHEKNLDSTQADLEKVEHDVDSARTKFGYSLKEKKRLGALFEEGVISEEEYDSAAKQADVDEKDLEADRAVVRDLRARVKYYKENVELTRLLAPISGRVVTPYIDKKVGQVLKQGDLFAEYEDMETVQAEVQLPEEYIDEITIGAQVKVRPQAYPARFFRGDVVLIAPKATDTPSGKVVRVITNIPNPKMELRSEMTGEAKIEGGWKPVIVAFTKAIVRFFMVEVWSWFP
jgi:putative peptide zinc metalloprotease protein